MLLANYIAMLLANYIGMLLANYIGMLLANYIVYLKLHFNYKLASYDTNFIDALSYKGNEEVLLYIYLNLDVCLIVAGKGGKIVTG